MLEAKELELYLMHSLFVSKYNFCFCQPYVRGVKWNRWATADGTPDCDDIQKITVPAPEVSDQLFLNLCLWAVVLFSVLQMIWGFFRAIY